MRRDMFVAQIVFLCWATGALGAEFFLITGVDPLRWPGVTQLLPPNPGPGFDGETGDGNRLAGTSEETDVAEFTGIGVPMYAPNEFGSMSFTFRRGSVPVPPFGVSPIMAVDFLGGPLLDLDGDIENGTRSLVPLVGGSAVEIPDSDSLVELDFDFEGGSVSLTRFDATGTNVGGFNIDASIATTLTILAGTANDGTLGDAINPEIDTRSGTVVPFAGDSGTLTGVFKIEDLGFELWQDSISPTAGATSVFGTFQFLGSIRGWLVVRDEQTGLFPALVSEGLGSTLWPVVNTDFAGESVVTANGLQGGSATIGTQAEVAGAVDDFVVIPGNGGLALDDADGNIGAYFDDVVVPLLGEDVMSFVYLESAGFGTNNSFDPVFTDSVGYDVVILAASPCGLNAGGASGDFDGDGVVNLVDLSGLNGCVAGEIFNCTSLDFDDDDDVDLLDVGGFQRAFGSSVEEPACGL